MVSETLETKFCVAMSNERNIKINQQYQKQNLSFPTRSLEERSILYQIII